jgi:hypothetical protein
MMRNKRIEMVTEMKRDTVLLNLDPRPNLNLCLKQLRQTLRIFPRVDSAEKTPSLLVKTSLFGDSEEDRP